MAAQYLRIPSAVKALLEYNGVDQETIIEVVFNPEKGAIIVKTQDDVEFTIVAFKTLIDD